MRRSAFHSILCMSAVCAGAVGILAGCEDGPNQPYSPAPAGAGNVWNSGDSPAAAGSASEGFGMANGGGSKTEICSGAELQQQWSKMIKQPIQPPYRMAGLDVSGGSSYPGLTLEQAENGPTSPVMGAMDPPTRLCQPGAVLGAGGNGSDVGGSIVVGWGNNNEFEMEWAVPTHKAYVLTLNPGYIGTMTWQGKDPTNADCANPGASNYQCCTAMNGMPNCDGQMHTWVWQIGQTMKKDGKTFEIRWQGYTATAQTNADADTVYRGLAATYAPEIFDNLPWGVTCVDSGTCLVSATGNDGIHPIIGFRPVSMYFNLYPPSFPQPSGSTVQSAYFFNIKYAPYSPSVTTIKMNDLIGPTGAITFNGATYKQGLQPCQLQLGGAFMDLMGNCVNVFADSATNTVAQAKVLGNLTHDDQNFTFSVVGDNQNYSPVALSLGQSRQYDVIHDSEMPGADAYATDFQFDVRAFGPIANDYYLKPKPNGDGLWHKDRHGSGAVWREWGRAVQADLAAKYHALHPNVPLRTYHDPACLFPMSCQGPGTCATDQTYSACSNDASGCVYAYNFPQGVDVYSWRPAEGCTGFEGQLTNAFPNASNVDGRQFDTTPMTGQNTPNPDDVWDLNGGLGGLSGGFKPGQPLALFCDDPYVQNFCGLSGDLLGTFNTTLDAALQRVTTFLGQGDILNVPAEGRDLRYYFKQLTIAYAKYAASSVANAKGAHARDANNNKVPDAEPLNAYIDFKLDYDNLIFDAYGGNAARSEYVNLDYADLQHDPTDFQLKYLLIGTNAQSTNFYRRLDREERAIFLAMENADAKADPTQAAWGFNRPGGDVTKPPTLDAYGFPKRNADVFLSNIAGAPAISNSGAWSGVSDGMGGFMPSTTPGVDPCFPDKGNGFILKTAQYCATTPNDTDCLSNGNLNPPLNDDGSLVTRDNGKPLLADYCGIWYGTPLSLTGPGNPSPLQLVGTDPLNEEAKVQIPLQKNPYDPTSGPATLTYTPPNGQKATFTGSLTAYVPWKPQQEGVGFPVMASGTNDVFVETAQLDFTGQVITPVMDYLPMTVTDDAGTHTNLQILAYETEDFLGDVFVCYDTVTAANRAGTGRPGDILAVHMYTSGQSVLDWMAAHPTAQDNCGIIVRYSPYNNYPDYIQGTSNGVRMGIDQASGFGRVVDVTVFAPGQGTPAPP